MLYPTAIGWNPPDAADERTRQREAWITIQRAHAVANGLPVLPCIRAGFEPDPSGHSEGIEFWGYSFIAGPQGEALSSADDRALVLIAVVVHSRSVAVRRFWRYLRDRRIDSYLTLALRYRDRA